MDKKNDSNMQKLNMDQLEAVSGGADDDQQREERWENYDSSETTAHSKHQRGLLPPFESNRGPR